MAEPVTCSVGGEIVTLTPILTLGELKRIEEPFAGLVEALQKGRMISADLARVRILSVALTKTRPDLTPQAIEDRLLVSVRNGVNERAQLVDAIDKLLDASELFPEAPKDPPKGEAEPAEAPVSDLAS